MAAKVSCMPVDQRTRLTLSGPISGLAGPKPRKDEEGIAMPIDYNISTVPDVAFTIEFMGSEVTIRPGDLSEIAEKGLHFKLPDGKPVELGKLKEAIEWLNAKFPAAKLPTEADTSWPQGIQDILNGVLTTKATVNLLNIDQEPRNEESKYPPMDLEISVTAKATGKIELIKDILSVTSVAMGVKRTHSKKAPQMKKR